MRQRSVPGNPELGIAIKERRNELKLTIEEAADKAGVGIKTWCRYEAGESIRQDKAKGVCRALNWKSLPSLADAEGTGFDLREYRSNACWSKYLEEQFGETAAASFVIGSEILDDYLTYELEKLSHMQKGSHIGEISVSFLADALPPQFLTRYDYEFLYALRCALRLWMGIAKYQTPFVARRVIDELALYLVVEESRIVIEEEDYTPEAGWDEWIFDVFGDMDIVTLLYSDVCLTTDNIYHFDHWMKEQFYMD